MTDTPGREPEQRLPAPRPSSEPTRSRPRRSSASRSPPSTRSVELTPERAAQVVRQSSNARWVGFLAVVVVILFVAIYWFYELGAPLGHDRVAAGRGGRRAGRSQRRARLQRLPGQLRALPRRRTARAAIGPALNRQDKLFQHLNANYLNTVLTAGGRYVCGNPTVAHAGLGEHGDPARPAQLPPDPGAHRVHPRDRAR